MENMDQPVAAEKKSKAWIWVLTGIILVVMIGLAFYMGAKKNKPSDEAVTAENETLATEDSKSKPKDANQYNWSAMTQGPYHDSVSFATGTSLTKWTDSGKVLAEHASVPDVILKEGTLYVYFVDVATDGIAEQLGLIKSSDSGKTWSDKQIVSIKGLGDKVAVDPNPYLLEDGQIRLYYFDISKTKTEGLQNNTIYSAISNDGLNFTQEAGKRFTYPAIFDPSVIKVDGVWRMYVGTDDQKVLSATSTDGMTFSYEGIALSSGAIPKVVYEDGTYYLFTGGIEISTSKDGKTFTKTTNRFDSGKLTADPGVVKLGDGSYFMVYKTKDESTVIK